ncbi:MAG: SLC13 family permease, partial [Mycobacterium leprae]
MVQELHGVPLLSRLPRVELAKLVSEIVTIPVARGDGVTSRDDETAYVYLIQAGKVGVYLESEEAPLILMTLGAGEIIDERAMSGEHKLTFRAVDESKLYRIPSARFYDLLSQHPALLKEFSDVMMNRSQYILDELVRTKSALMVHATEVWSMLENAAGALHELADNAGAETEPQNAEVATADEVQPKKHRPFPWRTLMVHGLPILAALLVLFVGQTHLTFSPVRSLLAILVWGVGAWLFDALPDYVVALTIGLAAGAFGIVKPEVALSGFSSRTWFLLLAVLGISAGITRTGLLYRVALQMLRLFPATYEGQSSALALGGLLLAPFLPGVTGRQAMASRLSLELSDAMGFKQRSKGAAGLAMACFAGFSCFYYISMTGGSVTLMVWSILPAAVKAGLSWSSWFVAALPVTLFAFAATLFAVIRLYAPGEHVHVSKEVVESQLAVLGPMGRQEWISVWVVLSIVLAFITQPLHGLDPTWVALPGFLLLGATGVLDKDTLRKGIDWGFLLLTGGLFGIAALTSEGSFVKVLSSSIIPLVKPLSANPWIFFTAIAITTMVVHL